MRGPAHGKGDGRPEPATGLDYLARALRARPDAVALDDGLGALTYRELALEADGLASRLGPRVRPGRVVAMLLPPGAAAVVAVHAVARSGAVLAPLSPRLTVHELTDALGTLRPAAVVAEAEGGERIRSAADAAGVALVEGRPGPPDPGPADARDGEARRSREEDRDVTDPRPPDEARLLREAHTAVRVLHAPTGGARRLEHPDAAAVLWTSGTTGRPRGVVLAASALAHVAEASRRRLDLAPDDRWYAALSPAHVGGLALIVRAALLGSAVVVRGTPDMAELSALMEAGRVTHTSLVPMLLRRLLEVRDGRPAPARLRSLLVGGAAAPPTLVERAVGLGYPVALTYGLTEATSQVATAPPSVVRRKPWTVGAPLDGVEVRTADDGEILIHGPTLALGILGTEGVTPLDREGWLHTGDLGEWDAEGHLRITGRRSDRIVTGGVTVDPREVEAVLMAHAAVREAAVVGIPDPEWGERVAAAVVMVPGAPSRLDDVEALCRERLTPAKIPRRLRTVEALPRNANGKVDREAVRALLAQGSRPPGP